MIGQKDKWIWDYIDGTLTEKQRLSFEESLEKDKELNDSYSAAKHIHEKLKNVPKFEELDPILIQNTIIRAKEVEQYVPSYGLSFGPFFIYFLILFGGAIILSWTGLEWSSSYNTEIIASLKQQMSILQFDYNLSNYYLLLLIFPIIFLIDHSVVAKIIRVPS